ncbi:endonuclease [Pontibacter sp. H249]|uniref:endonuclease n=1 Tax=Pontibacter sp. H249 TaxID=3133420 RepID=UPI0030C2B47C
MNKFLRIALVLLLFVQYAGAQTAPPSGLSGEELKAWLRVNWYDGKHKALSYSGDQGVRGYMYSYVDNDNGTVTCIYTGYQVQKPYNPTGGSTTMNKINCEHTVPQSFFGKASPMVSDIHHLFPTHETPNGVRSNYPFSDIDDTRTSTWHVGDSKGYYTSATIPKSNIDAYSESYSNTFEPREDHKGNTARAIFYFYTMYPTQAGSITRVGDIKTLYQWHQQDPVDERERERNRRAEAVQGNRNPYIDYPELVATAWGLTPAPCEATVQASNLSVSNLAPTTLTLGWASGNGNSRLVVIREGAAVAFTPAGTYTGVNANYTLAADQGQGHRLVHSAGGAGVTVTGLEANKTYYVQVFEYCASSEEYNQANAPAIAATTPDYTCHGTPAVASSLSAGDITQTGFTLNWTNGSGDGRIVVLRKGSPVTFEPVNGNSYTSSNPDYTLAGALADGSKLVYNGTASEVAITGLEAGTTYYAQVFESCSNGQMYAVAGAPAYAITSTAATTTPQPGNGNVLVMQNFNGTANDGWVVTSGFSSSIVNTGLPDGQRIKNGASLQVGGSGTVEFAEVNVKGKKDVYFELYNSVISTTTGNGIEAGDFFEVYLALNGAEYATVPVIRITGTTDHDNVRYGMDGTATISTSASAPLERIFTETGTLPIDKAPSKLQVTIPDGTESVKAKLVIKTSGTKEYWNVEDVALYAAVQSTDCDENPLESIAGEDKAICSGSVTMLGASAATDYTYTWSPATGLSDAAASNPTVTLTIPGVYTYKVAATNGTCSYEDEVTVTISDLPAKPVIAQDGTLLTASITGSSYEWYKGDQLINQENGQQVNVTESGLYKVRVKNEQGCFSELSEAHQVAIQPTALADATAKAGFILFPNPASDQVVVQAQQPVLQAQVVFVNTIGKTVLSKQVGDFTGLQEINISHLPAGVYFVYIKANGVLAVQRLIITK